MCALVARPEGTSMREALRRSELSLRWDRRFNGVKVFSSSALETREGVIERASVWLGLNPGVEVVEITVATTGVGPAECVSLVITYWQDS